MSFIIKINDNIYFAGWDAVLGGFKTTDNVNLAYRMRKPIAERTLPKIDEAFRTHAVIIRE